MKEIRLIRFIIFLALMINLIQCVNALSLEPETWLTFESQNVDLDASSLNKVIADAYFYLDAGEQVNLTLYYGNNVLSGYISYERPNFYTSRIYMVLGDQNATIDDYDLWGGEKTVFITYSLDGDNKSISMIYDNGNIFKPGISYTVQDLEFKPIWRLVANANSQIKIKIGLLSYQTYQEGWETTEEFESGDAENFITNLLNLSLIHI